jgi:hypothetical protein
MKCDSQTLSNMRSSSHLLPDPGGEVVRSLLDEIERLQAISDAAELFCAVPPDDMADSMPFQQYTTAGDCRLLVATLRSSTEAETTDGE